MHSEQVVEQINLWTPARDKGRAKEVVGLRENGGSGRGGDAKFRTIDSAPRNASIGSSMVHRVGPTMNWISLESAPRAKAS